MKLVVPSIALLVGLGVGWLLGKGQSRTQDLSFYSEDSIKTIAALTEVFGPLSENKIQDLIDDVNAYSEGAMRELELRYLWEGNAGYAILEAFEEGPSEAEKMATLFVNRFREEYSKKLEIGKWSAAAERLHSAITKTLDEPVDADNPGNPSRNSKNQLDD